MRVIISCLLIGLFFVTATDLLAQNKQTARRVYKDGVAHLEGRMVELRGGEMLPLTTTVVLPEGTRVTPDGMVIRKDGTRKKLAEGMAVNQSGRIVIFKDDMFTSETIQGNAKEIPNYQSETIFLQTDSTVIIRKE